MPGLRQAGRGEVQALLLQALRRYRSRALAEGELPRARRGTSRRGRRVRRANWTGPLRVLYSPPPSQWRAQVAQLVEHATENRSVGGSTPPLGTIPSQLWTPALRHRRQLPTVERPCLSNCRSRQFHQRGSRVRCRVVFVGKFFMVAVRDRFGMTVSPPFHLAAPRPCYAVSDRGSPAAVLLSFPMGRASRHVRCCTRLMDHHCPNGTPTLARLPSMRRDETLPQQRQDQGQCERQARRCLADLQVHGL